MIERRERFPGSYTARAALAWSGEKAYVLRRLVGREQIAVALAGSLLAFGILYAAWELGGKTVALVAHSATIGMLIGLLLMQAETSWRQKRSRALSRKQIQQVQALHSILSLSRSRAPLPVMGGYAISPLFGELLVSLIREVRPATVVELGSGVSTLIIGYCLEEQGGGRCISLEHDAGYAQESAANVEEHSMEGYVEVVHAPLQDVRLNGRTWPWYRPGSLDTITSVDMLVVDGPPGSIGHMARYPALALLNGKLSDRAVIVVDDTRKADERALVGLWLEQFPGFVAEEVETEKGAMVLRRTFARKNGPVPDLVHRAVTKE